MHDSRGSTRPSDVAVIGQDTVVHELAHAVGNSIDHPVTLIDLTDPNLPGASRYIEEYLNHIRSVEKPWSPP